ncbi:hypothetical protein D3C87_1483750 [compost metagenome]
MTGHEDLLPVLGRHKIDSGILRFSQDFKVRLVLDVLSADGGVTGMRYIEQLVESAQQLNIRNINRVREHPEAFIWQRDLRHAKVVIQSSLGSPTYMKR